jgi:hypothetical protein
LTAQVESKWVRVQSFRGSLSESKRVINLLQFVARLARLCLLLCKTEAVEKVISAEIDVQLFGVHRLRSCSSCLLASEAETSLSS